MGILFIEASEYAFKLGMACELIQHLSYLVLKLYPTTAEIVFRMNNHLILPLWESFYI